MTSALPAATLDHLLATARARGLERLDAQLLLGHVLARSRAWLLAHGEDVPTAAQAATFQALVERRAAGEPFAYLVGEREFHGIVLAVNPDVLVPRPDTETLVDWALTLLDHPSNDVPRPAVLDLGTGSGAIALALKSACPRTEMWAVERSAAALAVARENARRLQLEVRFVEGDWWSAVDGLDDAPRFDLVVSNPPYIAPGDVHLHALTHEPIVALVAADDGLADIVRIVADAPRHLNAGAWLLLEHGWEQGPAVRDLLARAGFMNVHTRLDLAQRPRCSGGRWR